MPDNGTLDWKSTKAGQLPCDIGFNNHILYLKSVFSNLNLPRLVVCLRKETTENKK